MTKVVRNAYLIESGCNFYIKVAQSAVILDCTVSGFRLDMLIEENFRDVEYTKVIKFHRYAFGSEIPSGLTYVGHDYTYSIYRSEVI